MNNIESITDNVADNVQSIIKQYIADISQSTNLANKDEKELKGILTKCISDNYKGETTLISILDAISRMTRYEIVNLQNEPKETTINNAQNNLGPEF